MISFRIPDFKMPNIKTVRLSVEQVKALPDEKLLALLNGEAGVDGIVPFSLQQIITSELLRRNLERTSKPHWSTVPSFCLLVTSVLLSVAAIVVAALAVPQVQQRTFPESQQPQTPAPGPSTPASLPPESQHSPTAPQVPQRR